MIYRLILAFLVIITPIAVMPQNTISLDDLDTKNLTLLIPSSQVKTQNIKYKIDLLCDNEGFIVKKGKTVKRVRSYNTDKLFRKIDLIKIAKYALLNEFKVLDLGNGEYAVRPHFGLKGGGVLGANIGFFTAKFIVYFIGHGAIMIVATCTGGAVLPTAAALEGTFLPVIEKISNVAAIGTSIAIAAFTGPV